MKVENTKTRLIGRILIFAAMKDSLTVQKILGKSIYFSKSGKWFFDIKELSNRSGSELTRFCEALR